jgi:hypothetical protein
MPNPAPSKALDLFDPLPTPAEMAAWDQAAIHDFGLRAEILMENAGAEALAVLREAYGPLAGTTGATPLCWPAGSWTRTRNPWCCTPGPSPAIAPRRATT